MKRAALAAIIPLALVVPAPGSTPWHRCPGGSGGAFDARVIGLSCSYASQVTEAGLTPRLRSTRLGDLACTRSRTGRLWRYHCARDGRQLSFLTF